MSEINFSNVKYISQEEANKLDDRCKPTYGDILLTKVGSIGRASTASIFATISAWIFLGGIGIFIFLISSKCKSGTPEPLTTLSYCKYEQLEIASGRFDCEYYQSRYFNFEESLINTDKYVLLKDLLQMIESGSRPTGGVGQIKDGILSFGGTHVSKDGYIIF
jgi:hypothetical protein